MIENNHIVSPLMLDGWIEFNCYKWRCRHHQVSITSSNSPLPAVSMVVYLNTKNKIFLPPRNPYLPVNFTSTATQHPARLYRQWLDVAHGLAEYHLRTGLASPICLPPEIVDVRSWKWLGFDVDIRYTFYVDFPVDNNMLDNSVRKQCRKAISNGYYCCNDGSLQDVIACLLDTEERQKFSHQLTLADLEMAQRLLGKQHFRSYVAYAPNGEPASARIVLHYPGTRTIDWIAGTKNKYLQSGATQLLISFVLEDLQANGAAGFDFAGANIPNIAAAKANWGGRLIPYYVIKPYLIKEFAKWLIAWRNFSKNS